MSVRLRPYGSRAVLAEPSAAAQVLPLAAAARSLAGVVEVVPGARTVLVRCVDGDALAAARAALPELASEPAPADGGAGAPVVLDVVYDGPDLAAVAAELGTSVDEVVGLHASADYVVAFCGFAPGFGYLTGLPDRLHLPRLPEPRPRVPAGSVGIAGEFTGAYPRASPGGWRLLGRTAATLWDLDRDPPALLAPGAAVRFRPVPGTP